MVVTWDDYDAKSFYPLDDGVLWLRLGFHRGWIGKVRRVTQLRGALKEHGAATLVGFVMSGDLTVILACLLARVQIIAAERNSPQMYDIVYTWPRKLLNLLQLHFSKRIVVQFPRYRDGYPGTLVSRICAISNPVESVYDLASPGKMGSWGGYNLLCVSRLDVRQKQILDLVEAFARIADRHVEWTLSILGDGPDRARISARVQELGLGDRVRMLGSVVDVSSYYRNAHLFSLPSRWEGFPNALAEAMAHGLPCVGYQAADGVSDLLQQGGGWLVPGQSNVSALAEILSFAMDNPRERDRRGALAAENVANYNPECIARQWTALLV